MLTCIKEGLDIVQVNKNVAGGPGQLEEVLLRL